MKVVAGRVSRGANIAYKLTLFNPVACVYNHAAAVGIEGGVGGIVVNGNVISPAVTPFIGFVCHHNGAGVGGVNRCAEACCHIKTFMTRVTHPFGRYIGVTGTRPKKVYTGYGRFRGGCNSR